MGAGYPKKKSYDARNLYDYEPLAGIQEGAEKHILGVQGNMWTEWVHNDPELFYMLIPPSRPSAKCSGQCLPTAATTISSAKWKTTTSA